MPSRSLILLPLLLALGCHDAPPQPQPPASETPSLLIGLIPEQNLFRQLERYEPLMNYVAREAGVTIHLNVLRHYGSVVRNFANDGMDGAFFGSFSYVLAHNKLGLEVIARPESFTGTSTYHGVLLTRRDSGITTPEAMAGRVFAFVDRATSAGFLFPLAYFGDHGIADYHTFFSETYFAGTHEAVIHDVLTGRADIGATKSTVYERLAATDPNVARGLSVLARSPRFPENAFAIRGDLAPELKQRLRDILMHLHEDPAAQPILRQFGARRFIATQDSDFAPVVAYAHAIGLNPATYDDSDHSEHEPTPSVPVTGRAASEQAPL